MGSADRALPERVVELSAKVVPGEVDVAKRRGEASVPRSRLDDNGALACLGERGTKAVAQSVERHRSVDARKDSITGEPLRDSQDEGLFGALRRLIMGSVENIGGQRSRLQLVENIWPESLQNRFGWRLISICNSVLTITLSTNQYQSSLALKR